MGRALAIVIALLALPGCTPDAPVAANVAATADAPVCAVTYVVDGDTLHLDCGSGQIKARLLGFDTPEIYHPHCPAELQAGQQAAGILQALVNQAPVTGAAFQGHDRYGRALVALRIGGVDVASHMIASGLALPYSGHRHPDWCSLLQG